MAKDKSKKEKWGGHPKPTRKEVFLAGFEAGETVDSAEEAWEAFKLDPTTFSGDREVEDTEPEDPDADEDDTDES